jgi:hypothetical protein
MIRKDYDISLLWKIIARVADFRDEVPSLLQTIDLLDLVPEVVSEGGEQKALFYLERHVIFLQDEGYLRRAASLPGTGLRVLSLSTKGDKFIQPELAEFGQPAMLPQVVKSLEDKIQVLSYPEAEKNGMLYRLRDALADKAPDFIAKVIVEVGSKALTGSP